MSIKYEKFFQKKNNQEINVKGDASKVPLQIEELLHLIANQKDYYVLHINHKERLYVPSKQKEAQKSKIKFKTADKVDYVYTNWSLGTFTAKEVFFDKEFTIEDVIVQNCWNFIEGDTIINGYKCHLATLAEPPYFDVKAYYTLELPIQAGPYIYGDLPGVVLRIERGNTIFKASAINFPQQLNIQQPKITAKPISFEKLTALKNKKIKQRRER